MYFVNLTVKTKLYLDNLWIMGTDYQKLFDYYNMFSRLPKYRNIKPSCFAKKLLHASISKKTTCTNIEDIEEFSKVADKTAEEEKNTGKSTS